MQVIIQPSAISGTITAPASKSAMQRACAAALLNGGKTILHNPGASEDDKAALDIIQQLGAVVEQDGSDLIIRSNGVHPVSNAINCGESGLSVRMFTSIAALSREEITINGKGSLLQRPLSFFNEVLPQLGVECRSNQGLLPLTIRGPLQPKNIEVDGSLSSQFLTGLLFAYSAAGATDVSIRVKNLNSKPYIDLTLQVMANFGLKTPVNSNYEEFYFPAKSIAEVSHSNSRYSVEGDWSGGAFLLVAGAINRSNRPVIIKGLDIFSSQADKAVLQALMQTGAAMSIRKDEIEMRGSLLQLKAFHFNATDCPDLFPPLVALAAYCDGTSVIEGIHRLTHKESNRALTLQEEFGRMGLQIDLQDDLMLIKGGRGMKGLRANSRHDHRIAMACAVAALRTIEPVSIDHAEAVNKSYPNFWSDIAKLGATIYQQD